MPPFGLLLLALLTLLLPAGWGLIVPVAVCRPLWPGAWRVSGAGRFGLLLLAAAPLVGAWAAVPSRAPAPGCAAVRLQGTWRHPPAGTPYLATPAGPLAVELADDVRAPAPGTPMRALARCASEGPPQIVSLVATGPPAGAWFDRWAQACAVRARLLLPHDDAGLLLSLVLGQRDDLGWPDRAAFRATGTTHVLAISGQQVALVAGALGLLAAGGSWRRPLLVLAGFVVVAGASAPLLRSAVGWLLVAAGVRLGRPADGLHRLAAVGLVLECWQPGLHLDLSAQLSFLAVAGLVAGARLVPGPAALALAPLGAYLATVPLCVEVFGLTQPAGLLVTPLLTPPLAVLLGASLVAVFPGALFTALDPLLAPVLSVAIDALRGVTTTCAHLVPAPLRPEPLPVPGALLGLAVVIALVLLGRRRPRALEAFA